MTDTPPLDIGLRTGRTVLFDMDGVVMQVPALGPVVRRRALDGLLSDWGLSVADEVRVRLEDGTYDEAFVEACGEIGVDAKTFFDALEARTAQQAIDWIAAGAREPYPDADSIVVIADHADVGLVSNHYDPTVRFVVEHFGLDEFGVVRGRDPGLDGYRKRKPEPHYLEEALADLDAASGIYVGDTETDVVAAERAGLDAVFLRRDHNADVELSHEPVAEIQSLAELLGLITPPQAYGV